MSALRRSNPSPIPFRPKSKLTHIPVVDLSRLNHNSTHRPLLLKDIARACRKHGYFQRKPNLLRGSCRKETAEDTNTTNMESSITYHPDVYILRKELDEGMQMLAVHSYPQFSQPDVMVGLFPHSDYGFITILHQNCHGLEVMEHDDKCWRAVPRQPGAFHVHINDHLEVLSNGEFKTLVHRAVLNPNNRRISIASIHSLSIDEKVSTAKELLDGQQPKRYKESSFRDYLDYLRWKIKNQRSFIESLKIGRA